MSQLEHVGKPHRDPPCKRAAPRDEREGNGYAGREKHGPAGADALVSGISHVYKALRPLRVRKCCGRARRCGTLR
jgi:hypothetical protein